MQEKKNSNLKVQKKYTISKFNFNFPALLVFMFCCYGNNLA